jgi:hypothetical protein
VTDIEQRARDGRCPAPPHDRTAAPMVARTQARPQGREGWMMSYDYIETGEFTSDKHAQHRSPDWTRPEQLEAYRVDTRETVYPLVPDKESWPYKLGGEPQYWLAVGRPGGWCWFHPDGSPLSPENPWRIRNRTTDPSLQEAAAELEALKREVSDALKGWYGAGHVPDTLARFIQSDPPAVDPLVEALRRHIDIRCDEDHAKNLRNELAKRGLAIVAQERGE